MVHSRKVWSWLLPAPTTSIMKLPTQPENLKTSPILPSVVANQRTWWHNRFWVIRIWAIIPQTTIRDPSTHSSEVNAKNSSRIARQITKGKEVRAMRIKGAVCLIISLLWIFRTHQGATEKPLTVKDMDLSPGDMRHRKWQQEDLDRVYQGPQTWWVVRVTFKRCRCSNWMITVGILHPCPLSQDARTAWITRPRRRKKKIKTKNL